MAKEDLPLVGFQPGDNASYVATLPGDGPLEYVRQSIRVINRPCVMCLGDGISSYGRAKGEYGRCLYCQGAGYYGTQDRRRNLPDPKPCGCGYPATPGDEDTCRKCGEAL